MFERIVLAVDGSEPAQRAVPVAADIASKYGSEVIAVHVLEKQIGRGGPVALETTEDPESVGRLWRAFADEALVDPSPPTWSYFLVDTHPSMARRVAMAEAWRERNE